VILLQQHGSPRGDKLNPKQRGLDSSKPPEFIGHSAIYELPEQPWHSFCCVGSWQANSKHGLIRRS
jgi:hypothetical protein